jgi:hypothetical protein
MMTIDMIRAAVERRKKNEAYRAKMDALRELPVTKEERVRWEDALHRVWQTIGPDVIDAWNLSKVKPTTGLLVDAVCDLGCFEMYSGLTKEEHMMLSAAYHRPSQQRWLRSVLSRCVP